MCVMRQSLENKYISNPPPPRRTSQETQIHTLLLLLCYWDSSVILFYCYYFVFAFLFFLYTKWIRSSKLTLLKLLRFLFIKTFETFVLCIWLKIQRHIFTRIQVTDKQCFKADTIQEIGVLCCINGYLKET